MCFFRLWMSLVVDFIFDVRFDPKSKILAPSEREAEIMSTKTDIETSVLKVTELDSESKLSKISKLRHLRLEDVRSNLIEIDQYNTKIT